MKNILFGIIGNIYVKRLLGITVGLGSAREVYRRSEAVNEGAEPQSLPTVDEYLHCPPVTSASPQPFSSRTHSVLPLVHAETINSPPENAGHFRGLVNQLAHLCDQRLSFLSRQSPTTLLQHLVWMSERHESLPRMRHFEEMSALVSILCHLLLSSTSPWQELDTQILAARFLANVSQFADSFSVFQSPIVSSVVQRWLDSDSIHLQLCATKIQLNVKYAQKDPTQRLVFGDTVYPLAGFDSDEEPEVDIVFVNGMRGSVFHTWRQYDGPGCSPEEDKTKSWPKDWLSKDVPKSRVYGLNVRLLPFMNDQYKHALYDNRPLKLRAEILRDQLLAAGLGTRPIVWVGHSAGGIFIKHILQSCTTSNTTDEEELTTMVTQNDGSEDAQQQNHLKELLERTVGVMFVSTPHRGTQSLNFLYYFPIKYTLTQESKEMGKDDEVLVELHEWFMREAKDRGIRTLNMVETLHTSINYFWSVVIVPVDERDTDFDEVVHVSANHIEVSKPKDSADLTYMTVVDFVRRSCDAATHREEELAPENRNAEDEQDRETVNMKQQ